MRRALIPILALSLACSHRADRERERFDQPDEAAQFYAMRHAVPAGCEPQERYATARAQMQAMHSRAGVEAVGAPLGPWEFLGPGNIGGRTRAFVFDPTNDNIMYAGGVSGGSKTNAREMGRGNGRTPATF